MKHIDMDNWDRREHYEFFRRADYAHYHIGCNVSIGRFRAGVKAQGLPFSFALTYVATAALNDVEAFRYRIHDDGVVLHERLHPYFAYNAPDKKYFKMVLAELGPDIGAFAHAAREKALAQQQYFIREDTLGRTDLAFISSIPGVAFTHLSHTITMANKNDAIPRLSWGQYFESEGKLLLPFNLQAHHAFVDGEHMGEYFAALQARLDAF